MFPESAFDPRHRSLPPTPGEVDAWAEREHKRRLAWAAGPVDEERDDWARSYRRRAVFGLEESRLGPTRDEIDQWVEREHKRREAWASGPTEWEKQEWVSRGQAPSGRYRPAPGPVEAEAEAWAEREASRRQEWLRGPSEEEKLHWAARGATHFWGEWIEPSGVPEALSDAAFELLREAELAGLGSLFTLAQGPAAIWSYFVRAGRAFEHEFYQPPRRSRVPY